MFVFSALLASCHKKSTLDHDEPSVIYNEGLVFNLTGAVTHFNPADLTVTHRDTLASWVVIAAQVWPDHNRMVVADSRTFRLAELQLPDFELVAETYIGGAPQDIASSPNMEHIYAITSNGNFWNFHPGSGITDTLEVKLDPRRMALKPPDYGQAWVVCSGNNMLHIFDVANMVAMDTMSFDHPPCAIAFTPDGHQAFIALTGNPGRLLTYDTDSLILQDDYSLGAGPFELAVSREGRYMAISDSTTGVLTIRDLQNDRRTWDFRVGTQLGRVCFSTDTQACYVLCIGNSSVVRILFGPDGPAPKDTLWTPATASQLMIWDSED